MCTVHPGHLVQIVELLSSPSGRNLPLKTSKARLRTLDGRWPVPSEVERGDVPSRVGEGIPRATCPTGRTTVIPPVPGRDGPIRVGRGRLTPGDGAWAEAASRGCRVRARRRPGEGSGTVHGLEDGIVAIDAAAPASEGNAAG